MTINNTEDLIDSRDVIARVEELESDIDGWENDIEEHQDEIINFEDELASQEDNSSELDDDKNADEIAEIANSMESLQSDIDNIESNISTIRKDIEEAQEELAPLKELVSDGEGYSEDWSYGSLLIRDSYFTEYAKEFGGLPNDLPEYIENNVDWDGVASDIQIDYASVDFNGVTYWVR